MAEGSTIQLNSIRNSVPMSAHDRLVRNPSVGVVFLEHAEVAAGERSVLLQLARSGSQTRASGACQGY